MRNLIGITGGIGAGKSVVSRILRILGYPVYDCDLEARRLMDDDEKLHSEIEERLGSKCLEVDGSLCRSAIAEVIFSDEEARCWLNSRVHKAVREDVIRFAEENADRNVFVESAILVTSRLTSLCSEIWLIEAPVEVRIKRVVARNGLSRQNILERMESQRAEFYFAETFPPEKIKIIPNESDKSLLGSLLPILPPLSFDPSRSA